MWGESGNESAMCTLVLRMKKLQRASFWGGRVVTNAPSHVRHWPSGGLASDVPVALLFVRSRVGGTIWASTNAPASLRVYYCLKLHLARSICPIAPPAVGVSANLGSVELR
ncbi:hypothetical protein TcWFU_006120 [Taenia crassiceps]|uniref:Uncharacterized protein n=1 Tax=Taenia crassiceps TaxID=6207 RepID=A0ABR4QHK2_9CEST